MRGPFVPVENKSGYGEQQPLKRNAYTVDAEVLLEQACQISLPRVGWDGNLETLPREARRSIKKGSTGMTAQSAHLPAATDSFVQIPPRGECCLAFRTALVILVLAALYVAVAYALKWHGDKVASRFGMDGGESVVEARRLQEAHAFLSRAFLYSFDVDASPSRDLQSAISPINEVSTHVFASNDAATAGRRAQASTTQAPPSTVVTPPLAIFTLPFAAPSPVPYLATLPPLVPLQNTSASVSSTVSQADTQLQTARDATTAPSSVGAIVSQATIQPQTARDAATVPPFVTIQTTSLFVSITVPPKASITVPPSAQVLPQSNGSWASASNRSRIVNSSHQNLTLAQSNAKQMPQTSGSPSSQTAAELHSTTSSPGHSSAQQILQNASSSQSSQRSENAQQPQHEQGGGGERLLNLWVLMMGLLLGIGTAAYSSACFVMGVFHYFNHVRRICDQAVGFMLDTVEYDVRVMVDEGTADTRTSAGVGAIGREIRSSVWVAWKDIDIADAIPWPLKRNRNLFLLVFISLLIILAIKFLADYSFSAPVMVSMWTTLALMVFNSLVCSMIVIRLVVNAGFRLIQTRIRHDLYQALVMVIPGGLANLQARLDRAINPQDEVTSETTPGVVESLTNECAVQ